MPAPFTPLGASSASFQTVEALEAALQQSSLLCHVQSFTVRGRRYDISADGRAHERLGRWQRLLRCFLGCFGHRASRDSQERERKISAMLLRARNQVQMLRHALPEGVQCISSSYGQEQEQGLFTVTRAHASAVPQPLGAIYPEPAQSHPATMPTTSPAYRFLARCSGVVPQPVSDPQSPQPQPQPQPQPSPSPSPSPPSSPSTDSSSRSCLKDTGGKGNEKPKKHVRFSVDGGGNGDDNPAFEEDPGQGTSTGVECSGGEPLSWRKSLKKPPSE